MQTKNLSTGKNEQGLNVVDLLLYLASKWKWFVLSVLVFGGLAYVWYASSPQVYFRSATVIIKDPSNKTTTAGLDRYDNFINKVNVANEILQFLLQLLSCEEDAAFYCSKRQSQAFGYLAVLKSGDVHGKRHFIITWQ